MSMGKVCVMASEALAQSLVPVIQGHLEALLTQVSKDYSLDLEELKRKYLSSAKPQTKIQTKVKGPPVNPCKGKTAKGGPCQVSAKDGCEFCHLHMKPKKIKEPKVACTGFTGKGVPCRVRAQPGQTMCHLHLKSKTKKTPIRAETQVVPDVEPEVFCKPCTSQPEVAVPYASQPEVAVPCTSQPEVAAPVLEDEDQDTGAKLMSRLQDIIRSASESDAGKMEYDEDDDEDEDEDSQTGSPYGSFSMIDAVNGYISE
jgi:hypothetical protein